MLLEFKNAVDSFAATISADNLKDACDLLGIDTTNGYGGSQISDKLYQIIRDAIHLNNEDEDKISRSAFFKLQTELIYRYILFDENPIEYLKVLQVIRDSCRQNGNYLSSFSNKEDWEKAIVSAKNYNTFSPSTFPLQLGSLRQDYPRDFDIATSVKLLVGKGCSVEIADSNIHIISGLELVVQEIEEKVKTIGGVVVMKSLFNHLSTNSKYSSEFERYFFVREASGLSSNQSPQIPYGFLLNLALKYPYESQGVKHPQKWLDEILHLSINVSNGAYGVQQYSFWEFHFQSAETIVEFYVDIVLWDTMFAVSQCRPSFALDICDNLFSFISEDDFKNALGFTRAEFIIVSAQLDKLITNIHSPTIVYHSALCKILKHIDKKVIQMVLDLLSHQSQVNKNYNLPSDYISIDFWKKPLIKLGPTKFFLVNQSWSAPNFFEAVTTPLRSYFKSHNKNLDNELGKQLELYLQSKMMAKGISFITGDYEVDGLHGECDFMIESDKAIILIEFKKKVLTGKAKSGVDIDLIIDLSESILNAQIQAGRTEIILREKGEITLKNAVRTQTIYLKGRSIERVALTQLEFGGLHDRAIFKHFLVTLLTHSFNTHSKDSKIVERFNKLNDKQQQWAEQYNKLCEIDTNYHKNPFFDCWFMSLPQLLEIINLSTGNNSFYDNFRKSKHISLSTLDWYYEFAAAAHYKHTKS